jgi:hypothetical protein
MILMIADMQTVNEPPLPLRQKKQNDPREFRPRSDILSSKPKAK